MLRKIIVLVSIFIFAPATAQKDWSLQKDKDGIKIYTRSVAETSINEYKAVTIVETSIENVLNELLDAPQYYEGCPSGISYYVKKHGANSHLFYVKKELPWPLKDRDIVTLLTVQEITPNTYKLTLESLPNGIPSQKNTLRIKKLMGHWLLEEKNNTTMVTQRLHLDVEGNIPPAITNLLLVNGPYNTFTDLQLAVKKYNTNTSRVEKSMGL